MTTAPYPLVRECFEGQGLDPTGEGLWLYRSSNGRGLYLLGVRPSSSGMVYIPSVLSDVWQQLPNEPIPAAIAECLERLLD